MTTNSFNVMVDTVVILVGLYVFYGCWKMKVTGEIMGGMLMPKGLDLTKCNDKKGFIKAITPKMIILAVGALVSGLVGLSVDMAELLPYWVYMIAMGLFLADLIWYTIQSKKIIKVFWDKRYLHW